MSQPVRKIALVGTSSTGANAPYRDPSWEIWGVSARAAYVTRADRWFELHRLDGEPQDWADNWRRTFKGYSADIGEVLMLYPEPDLAPKVTRYPAERITARFGTYFMTSTFAWMMALAIDEMCPRGGEWNPGEIAIYGVEMEYGTEYRQQRAGFRHFIDLARVLGIKVTRLADGGLAYEPVPYPMWQDDPLLAKNAKRQRETLETLNKLEKTRRSARDMCISAESGIFEAQLAGQPGYDPQARIALLSKQRAVAENSAQSLLREIAQNRGQYEEQCWLNDYLQP